MCKETEKEQEKLIEDLQDAATMLKSRSGLLTVCASCKKVRDNKGHWKLIESNFKDDSEAGFSHGICDNCAKKLYPEIYDEDEGSEHDIFESPLPYPSEQF